MRHTPRQSFRVAIATLLVLTTVFGSTAVAASPQPAIGERGYDPDIDPNNFVSVIDNPYFPLHPGTTFVYRGMSHGERERNVVVVTFRKKMILGVETTVVRDTVWVDGEIAEKTFDWYAQDKDGNVWYFGEFSQEYENGVPINTDGSWEAGVDGALPGIVMLAHPQPGDTYRQEFYKGEAEDKARVVRLGASITVPFGSFDDVLVTREWTPLEPGVAEKKYYAPCIGNILVRQVAGGDNFVRLVDVRTAGNVPQRGCND